jgi:hypothetical protein
LIKIYPEKRWHPCVFQVNELPKNSITCCYGHIFKTFLLKPRFLFMVLLLCGFMRIKNICVYYFIHKFIDLSIF